MVSGPGGQGAARHGSESDSAYILRYLSGDVFVFVGFVSVFVSGYFCARMKI